MRRSTKPVGLFRRWRRHYGGAAVEDRCSLLSGVVLSHAGSDARDLYDALPPELVGADESPSADLVDGVLKRLWNDGPRAVLFFWALLLHHPRYRPAASSFDHALDLAARVRDHAAVSRLLSMRLKLRVEPTRRTFAILMERQAAAGRPDRAVRLFLSMHRHGCQQDLPAFNALLDALCKARRVDKAVRVFRALRRRFPPDAVTYNTLADGMCRISRAPAATDLFADMVRSGVEPTLATYNILLKGFFVSGQPKRAWEFFLQMRRREVHADVVTYTTLVHGLGMAGDLAKARQLFEEMPLRGCPPSAATYNALIQVVCKRESASGALRLLDEMVDRGCAPNGVTYNVLIKGLCRAGAAGEAAGFLERMRREECGPTAQAHNILIRHHCQAGDIDEGLRLFRGMCSACLPDADTYKILIAATFRRRKTDDVATAGQLLREMAGRGFVPPRRAFERVLDGLLICGQQEVARDILRALGERGGRLAREIRLR